MQALAQERNQEAQQQPIRERLRSAEAAGHAHPDLIARLADAEVPKLTTEDKALYI